MTTEEKIYLASKAAEKGWDYETFLYSDDLYGEEDKSQLAEDIWEYVNEYKEIGSIQFIQKYKDYKLYPS